MKITILCVGKIKEKFYRDAIEEYAKRLTRYCKLEIIEVADEKTPDGASATEEMQIRQKEGERVLARLEKCRQSSSYVMALAIDGRELDSVELSQKLEKLGTDGISHVIFLIGGSLGMSKELLAAADFKLSFSRMTFPHQLMRVILLEQIYRGYRIMNREPSPQIAAGYSVKSLEYRTVPSGFKAVSRMAMPFMPVSSAICARSEEKVEA